MGSACVENSFLNAQRAGHSSAPEATVAIRVLAEVLLVVVLCIVEGLALPDVSGDGAKAMLEENLWRQEKAVQAKGGGGAAGLGH